MILGSINIAYPYKEFSVRARRKLSTIEWLILEIIYQSSIKKVCEEITLNDALNDVFQICDSDLLVKPCLINLQNLEAIKGNILCEESSLKKVKITDFEITEKGLSILKKGLLPSKKNKNRIVAFYDIYNKKIVDNVNGMSENPLGLPVVDVSNASKVMYESDLLKEILYSDKYKEKYEWLQGNENIIEIENENSNLFWTSTTKEVEIIKDGLVSLIKVNDEKLNSLLFNSHNGLKYISDFKNINIKDCDEELTDIFFIDELGSKIDKTIDKVINENMGKGIIGFINKKFENENFNTKKLKGLVIFNSDKFRVNVEEKQLRVELPKGILDDECVIFLGKESIFAGNIKAYNDFGNRKFSVGYKKNQVDLSQTEIINKIIEEYRDIDYRVIALAASKNKKVVLQNLNEILKDNKGDSDKYRIAYDVKSLSKKIFGEKVDISNLIKKVR